MPKIKLLYYKNLLDKCFARFFNDFNDDFIQQNGVYVFNASWSVFHFKKIFREYLCDELRKYIKPNTIVGADYYFIIGSCVPKDNILLDIQSGYFPEKLRKIIMSDYNIKYFLREKDIKIDLVFFNTMLEELFLQFFKNHQKISQYVGNKYTNLFFIQHARLDCLTMYKTIKHIYGRSNTENLHKTLFKDDKTIIYSINEQIDKYVHDKSILNNMGEFHRIMKEVNQYVDECIKISIKKKTQPV